MQGVPEQKLRSHLGSFGVTGNLALQPMYTLSGIFFIPYCQYLKDISWFSWSIWILALFSKCLNGIYFLLLHHVLGGQKSRVAFAKITFKKPHIILLDEPSNHLVSHDPSHYFNILKNGILDLELSPPWLIFDLFTCWHVGLGCCGGTNTRSCYLPRRHSHGTLSQSRHDFYSQQKLIYHS